MFGIETTKVVKYVSSIHSLNHSFIHSLILASVFVQWKLNNNHKKKFHILLNLVLYLPDSYRSIFDHHPFYHSQWCYIFGQKKCCSSCYVIIVFVVVKKGLSLTTLTIIEWPQKKLSEDCHHNNYISYSNIGPFINVSSLLLWWWWLWLL